MAGWPLSRHFARSCPYRRDRIAADCRSGDSGVPAAPEQCRTIPDRLFLGSGTLGIIARAWMRLQHRPRWPGHGVGGTATGPPRSPRPDDQAGLYPATAGWIRPGVAECRRPLVAGCWCWRSVADRDRPVAPRGAVAITADGGTVARPRNYKRRNGTQRSLGWRSAVSAHAVSTRRAGSPQVIADIRNRLHLGRIRYSTCRGDRCRSGRDLEGVGPGSDLSIHPCLPSWLPYYSIYARALGSLDAGGTRSRLPCRGVGASGELPSPPPCGRLKPPM